MTNKIKPALVGGLIAGILSVIPIVSTCCCIWAILGGLLASFMYIKSAPPVPVTPGEGAAVGAMTGVMAAIIYVIIGLPIQLFFGPAQMEEAFRRSGVEVPLTGIALVLIGVFFVAVLLLVFSTIGGVIGVPIFEKRKGDQPTPPPQNFGAGPGGPYGTGV